MNPFPSPPGTVEAGGEEIPIHTDFRVWAQFEAEATRGTARAAELLVLCYPRFPRHPAEALDRAIWFYRCGHGEEPDTGDKSGLRPCGRAYDFVQDAALLTASFRAAYGIDLDTDYVHWWTFRALMLGLPSDTPFMQVVGYRTADTKGMTKAQKKFYAEMKARYAIREHGAALTLEERDQRMKDYVAARLREINSTKP